MRRYALLDKHISRRSFLQTAAAVGCGLTVGLDGPSGAALAGEALSFSFPNPWLKIDAKSMTFVLDKTEMGQGVITSMSLIIAEELDVDLEQLTIEAAPADRVYAKFSDLGVQMTGGSSSIRSSWGPLKIIGATARQMLVNAAAKRWGVAPSECRTASGVVYHDGSGKSGPYGAFADLAASLPVPAATFKDPATYRYVGKSVKRIDAKAKVTGVTRYGIDTVVPNMLVASVVRCPFIGGRVKKFDDLEVRKSPGVRHIIELSYGVAVVADSYWQARKAAKLLVITWDEGDRASLSSATIREQFIGASKSGGKKIRHDGKIADDFHAAKELVGVVYETPYLAHATMEPQNCVASVTPTSCEVWAPTQTPGLCMEVARDITGFSTDNIKIHTTAIGGGFGRRLVADFVAEAIIIAKQAAVTVKVIWSREEDLHHDFYRPASYNVMSGGVDLDGRPVFWKHLIVSPSILSQFIPQAMTGLLPTWVPTGIGKFIGSTVGRGFHGLMADDTSTEGAKDVAYAVPNVHVDYHHADPGIPIGFWRSVGHSHQAFMVEGFIDELANLAGKDPYQYRRDLLTGQPRNLGVLDRVAAEVGWAKPAAKGVFRGIAQHASFGSFCAQAVEISVDAAGNLKIHRVVAAIDCGPVVNLDGVKSQIEGAIIFGLSAALKGEITFEHGQVQQTNFHDYEVVRMNESPKIEVHIIASDHPASGVGEPGVPPIAPALANAIFAATGKRLRRLPLKWNA
jgi:isoquinoline 1-oxidoreductase subunit beta